MKINKKKANSEYKKQIEALLGNYLFEIFGIKIRLNAQFVNFVFKVLDESKRNCVI